MNNIKIGERVNYLRTVSGMTQEQLSAASGVSRKTISDYEKGAIENPTINTLTELANGIGVSVKDMIPDEVDISTLKGELLTVSCDDDFVYLTSIKHNEVFWTDKCWLDKIRTEKWYYWSESFSKIEYVRSGNFNTIGDFLHRRVIEWSGGTLPDPQYYVIDHLDEDAHNCCIGNLQIANRGLNGAKGRLQKKLHKKGLGRITIIYEDDCIKIKLLCKNMKYVFSYQDVLYDSIIIDHNLICRTLLAFNTVESIIPILHCTKEELTKFSFVR